MEQPTSLKLGKENVKANILSSWLFNFYAEYFMWNAELDISYAEIKISGRNINNSDMQMRLHYSGVWCYNGTIMAESKEELKSLLIRVKEESEKAGWKLNIKETKIMVSGPITSWQIEGGKLKTVTNFIFLGSKIPADSVCGHEVKSHLLLGKRAMTNLDSLLKSRDIFFLADKVLLSQSYGLVVIQIWELNRKEG